ncbi:phosphatidylinositol 3- and 4-kinase [Ceratobasidium sp. AG-Ba]|nr:phosphatidylinositol 3- and 4-kinase [Ceratobasidium sp. AG-Ba]
MASNLARALQPQSARAAFENDILLSKMSLRQYVLKLQKWRDRYDTQPEYSRTPRKPLQSISHWLTEFHHNKFEEPIEVPGQYLQHKDTPHGFVRIQRFASRVEFCRSLEAHFRRIGMHGHDGSFHTFAVQQNGRHTRREERSMQLFRSFNSALDRRKETRKRNLNFHLPAAISFSHSLRLLENDASYVSLQDMLEQHCKDKGIHRDDAQFHFLDKLKTLRNPEGTKVDFFTLRAEIISEISAKLVPATVLSNVYARSYGTLDNAQAVCSSNGRNVIHVFLLLCQWSASPALPSFAVDRKDVHVGSASYLEQQTSVIHNGEVCPFRFTPNMQHFVTPIGIEGLLTSGIMAIARGLTEPSFDLEQQLSLFLRDEVYAWYLNAVPQPTMLPHDLIFRRAVQTNTESLLKKADVIACRVPSDMNASSTQVPNQNITDLIVRATQEQMLAQMEVTFQAWM